LDLRVDAPRWVRPHTRIADDFDVENGMDTLTKRYRELQHGESLYPWSHTKLRIGANGKRTWVAKRPEDYYDE
jgi:hypothetical protein